MANPEETKVMEESKLDEHGIVSSIIVRGYDGYAWSKEKAIKTKMGAKLVEPSLNFIESKLSVAKEMSPVPVEKVVSVLDTRVGNAIDTIQVVVKKPAELKNGTLMVLHKNLDKFKYEDGYGEAEEETKETDVEDEASLQVIYKDMKQITTERAAKVLDVSESLVNKYLPEAEEEAKIDDEESLEVSKSTYAYRAFTISKVVTKRMQRRALSKLSQLKRRTTDVAHVDLVSYSNMLDMDSKKVWLSEKTETVKSGLGKTVVEPLRSVGGKLEHQYGNLKNKAKAYQEVARSRIVQIKIPYSDNIYAVWTTVGTTCDQKLVKPVEQIIDTFRQELHKQQEIVKNKEDDPNKPLTIEAGLRAVVAAARFRLKKEWENRVSPGIDIALSHTPFRRKQQPEDVPQTESSFKVGLEDEESDESNESTEPLFDAQDQD